MRGQQIAPALQRRDKGRTARQRPFTKSRGEQQAVTVPRAPGFAPHQGRVTLEHPVQSLLLVAQPNRQKNAAAWPSAAVDAGAPEENDGGIVGQCADAAEGAELRMVGWRRGGEQDDPA